MADKIEVGPTGRTVASQVAWLRKQRKWSYPELSRAVSETGWKLPVLALRRIEEGERKVTVDDAVHLALALEVPLRELLLPALPTGADEVELAKYPATQVGLEEGSGRGLSPTEARRLADQIERALLAKAQGEKAFAGLRQPVSISTVRASTEAQEMNSDGDD